MTYAKTMQNPVPLKIHWAMLIVAASLTTGMYNNPLCVYREYIQNAADAIDRAAFDEKRAIDDFEIRITLVPQDKLKRITVEDNGCGVSLRSAAKELLSLGNSQKSNDRERGFRGIGRLGGIAYCDTIVFTTKAKGETEETRVVWDCKKVQQMLDRSNIHSRGIEVQQLIEKCVSVETPLSGRKKNESFFRVEMVGVRSALGELLDYPKVASYLAEHAPVPFDEQKLFFGSELDAWLRGEVPNYNTYRIFINDSLIKKPYAQTLPLREKKTDGLTHYEKFNIVDRQDKVIARGWYGVRKDNIGQIASQQGIDSLRVRVGNILIGDATLVDQCFRESRFNGYLVGEIHIVSPMLVPNARRDDFEDSLMKSDFISDVRRIVEPLAKKIRDDSKSKSNRKSIERAKTIITTASSQLTKGFVGDAAKRDQLSNFRSSKEELENLQRKTSVPSKVKEAAEKHVEKLEELESKVQAAKPNLAKLSDSYSLKEREAIRMALEAVYSLYGKTGSAQELVNRAVEKLNRMR